MSVFSYRMCDRLQERIYILSMHDDKIISVARNATAFVMILFLLCLLCAPVATESGYAMTSSEDAVIYWVYDQSKFDELLGAAVSEKNAVHSLSVSDVNSGPVMSWYTFDIDGEGGNAPVTLTGELTEEEYGEYLILTGFFEGNARINGVDYQIYVVIHKEATGSRMSAGITVVPETAKSLEDYIFFSMGESVFTSEMLKNTSPDGIRQAGADSGNTPAGRELSSFTYLAHEYGYFSDTGPVANQISQDLTFYKETNGNGIAASVNSYTDAVNAHFSDYGQAKTTIREVTVGFRKVSGDDVHIINFEDFAMGKHTSYTDDSLTTAAEKVSVGNRRAEVTRRFRNRDYVSYDNEPLFVELNLSVEGPAPSAEFYAYSSIKYYTMYVPTGSDIPVSIVINGNSAQTSVYDIAFTY